MKQPLGALVAGKQVEEWSKFYGQRKRALWGWGGGAVRWAGAVGVPGKERETEVCGWRGGGAGGGV